MAQGGRIQQPNINVFINVTQDGDKIRFTNVEQQTNIEGSEIGQILIPSATGLNPGAAGVVDEMLVDEANVAADSATQLPRSQPPSSKQNLPTEVGRIKFPEQHRDNHVEEERADLLIKDSKFEEAVDLLEDLPPSQRQQMQLMDCHIQLGRDVMLLKCIETMQMLMTRHPRPNADDVYNLGVTHFECFSYIRALAFLSCASKLYKFDSIADNAVAQLGKCSLKCSDLILTMIHQGGAWMRVIARDIGLSLMREILKDVRSIDANPNVRVDREARCVNHIGGCYHGLGKFEKAITYRKKSLDILERQFGANASYYSVFGYVLNNLGHIYENIGQYHEAETWYLKARDAKQRVGNWESEKQKKQVIEQTENDMRRLRRRMEKK